VRRALLCLLLAAVALAPAAAASAADSTEAAAAPTEIPSGQATEIASRDPNVFKERQEHPHLTSNANLVEGHWEVAWFAQEGGETKEVALVLVNKESGEVMESWTGDQVAWKMARGYSGQFGHKLNAPYVFIPLCLFFFIGLCDWRRWKRIANLDLVVLLAFGVSHIFFNRGEIGVSVPLQYPVLAYLLARALWIGFRGRGEGLRPVWSVKVLLIAALFLMGVRVGLNVADAGVIDVGYASVVGADRISHGEPIYDNFPEDVSEGDTYGPVNYFAYVPFERIWPWSGSWDDLPAAHGAAVVFDLLAFGLLILLGLRIRPGPAGRRLATILAFGWAAYPYTAFTLEANSNDCLVALLLVATLLVLARPIARGALASLATFAKFAPALLAPMLMTYNPNLESEPGSGEPGVRGRRPRPQDALLARPALLFAGTFIAVGVLAMLWPAIDPGLKTTWERTIAFQSGRDSPFSIWGQVSSLEWLRTLILIATGALALALAFVPRRKSLLQVAALGAALLIALQLTMHHWFYLYITWWFPLLLVALALLEPRTAREPEPSPAQTSQPAPVG
jgi:hypothetical protein